MTTTRNIKIFIEVYQTLNITETAKALYMSQPAVSRAIMDLEEEYHIRLFERYHRRLIPTQEAHKLYTYGKQVIDSIAMMENMLQDESTKTIIRIGSSITIGNIYLPTIIQQFSTQYPNINCKVTIANGATLQQKLLNNEIDIALIEDSIHESELTTTPLCHDCLKLILPLQHPLLNKKEITLEDISKYPLLLREKGSAGREYLDHLFSLHNIEIDPTWESCSTNALIQAVKNGLGISILPTHLVENDLHQQTITTKPIKNLLMQRTYYIVYHKDKYFTQSLTTFKDFVVQTIGESNGNTICTD